MQDEADAEAGRMQAAVLAAVSDDLRTPLAAIKASVTTLRQADVQWAAADQADLLADIDASADRLDARIGNLLDISSLHAGALQPCLRPVAIDEAAAAALLTIHGRPGLDVDVPEDLPLILADPGLLERALTNLLANALRHSPPARPPALRARLVSGAIQLDVIDHGPGAPGERAQHIFGPFTAAGRDSGTRLGLAVAKGLTEAMGGTVAARGTEGGGLTVRITLPAASRGKATLDAGP